MYAVHGLLAVAADTLRALSSERLDTPCDDDTSWFPTPRIRPECRPPKVLRPRGRAPSSNRSLRPPCVATAPATPRTNTPASGASGRARARARGALGAGTPACGGSGQLRAWRAGAWRTAGGISM
jgi:hypothetical protein